MHSSVTWLANTALPMKHYIDLNHGIFKAGRLQGECGNAMRQCDIRSGYCGGPVA